VAVDVNLDAFPTPRLPVLNVDAAKFNDFSDSSRRRFAGRASDVRKSRDDASPVAVPTSARNAKTSVDSRRTLVSISIA
ncbi:MAG: hypothetical protein IJZ10_07830, partial [Thermoguttaceae bacterium]|nr:hypothetical protein [Thermoguttaceae bacterium]